MKRVFLATQPSDQQTVSSDEANAVLSSEHSLTVDLGTHVELELIDETGTAEDLALELVPDDQADFVNGFLGIGTPLAQAILGKSAGEMVAYRLDDVTRVRIVTVTSATRIQAENVAARRQAVIQQAVAESDRISDMVFALAVGSKWGDYDPGSAKE